MKYFLLIIFSCYIHEMYSQNEIKDSILFKKINEVVVTGQLTDKSSEEAVHKFRVITSKKLQSGLFKDLGQVLDKELNIRLSQDNLLGSSISLQGISGQNVKILIDDIPVIGRLNGNVDLSQISLNNIDRIEIVEGTLSTIYGTDALAGTINLITKKDPAFNKSYNIYYETVGKYNFDFILAKRLKNKIFTYQFERNFFNGWSDNQKFTLIPAEELADQSRVKTWKPKEQFVNKIQYNLKGEKLEIYNYIDFFSEKITNRGLPREPYFENAFDEYYYTYRTNLGSNINFNNNKDRVKILLAYNTYTRVKQKFYKDLTTLSSTLVEDPSAQDTSFFDLLTLKAIISNNESNKLQYQFGLESQLESAKGNRILDGRQDQLDFALFSTMEYNLNNTLIFRPSVRSLYNSNYKAPFIPALNVLMILNKYNLRIGMAKGFRAPSFKELYLDFVDINHNIVGNPSLLAEESINYQINNTYTYSMSKFILKTDLDLFYNIISNKIDLASSKIVNGQYSYFNIEEYKTLGVSSGISVSSKNLEINSGISRIGRYNRLSATQIISNFTFSTDYNFNVIINIGNKSKVNMFYKYAGRIPSFVMNGEDVVESYIDNYNLLDISINRRVSDLFLISLGAKNILDIIDVRKSNDVETTHSSANDSFSIGYGRTFFIHLNFNL